MSVYLQFALALAVALDTAKPLDNECTVSISSSQTQWWSGLHIRLVCVASCMAGGLAEGVTSCCCSAPEEALPRAAIRWAGFMDLIGAA